VNSRSSRDGVASDAVRSDPGRSREGAARGRAARSPQGRRRAPSEVKVRARAVMSASRAVVASTLSWHGVWRRPGAKAVAAEPFCYVLDRDEAFDCEPWARRGAGEGVSGACGRGAPPPWSRGLERAAVSPSTVLRSYGCGRDRQAVGYVVRAKWRLAGSDPVRVGLSFAVRRGSRVLTCDAMRAVRQVSCGVRRADDSS